MIREANIHDITQMHVVRLAVKENRLSNPDIITTADYTEFINVKGKGWVYEIGNLVVGFAVADVVDKNVWALFIDPVLIGILIMATIIFG